MTPTFDPLLRLHTPTLETPKFDLGPMQCVMSWCAWTLRLCWPKWLDKMYYSKTTKVLTLWTFSFTPAIKVIVWCSWVGRNNTETFLSSTKENIQKSWLYKRIITITFFGFRTDWQFYLTHIYKIVLLPNKNILNYSFFLCKHTCWVLLLFSLQPSIINSLQNSYNSPLQPSVISSTLQPLIQKFLHCCNYYIID